MDKDDVRSLSGRATPAEPVVSALREGIANAVSDWMLARYLSRRCRKRKTTICRRRSDDTLWAGSSPQNMGYAMRGLFSKKPNFHFAAVTIWRGVPIVVPKIFWAFDGHGQFDIMEKDATAYWLKPWPESVECAKIDAIADQSPEGGDACGSIHASGGASAIAQTEDPS